MDKKNIVKLAVDACNGTIKGTYSLSDANEALHAALVEANGGSSKLDYRSMRDGRSATLFSIIEEIITKTVIEGMPETSPIFNFIEWRNISDGDSYIFDIVDDIPFIVSDISQGTQGLRRQRVTGGEEIAIKPTLKGIKIYEELRRVLAGRVDLVKLIAKVSDSFREKISEDCCAALSGAFEGIAAPYTNGSAGSFSEDKLADIIDHVEAATGKRATILGSKKAIRKITGVRGADSTSAKEDLYAFGYFGHFYTTPIIALKNGHKSGTTDFILDDDLYIIAGDDKFIKGVTEGETLIIDGRGTTNADLSQEYMIAMSYGLKAVVASQMGIYRLS